MTGPTGLDFEPEIQFPENAFDAARVFLGAMAYPERGAGQPGGLGAPFTAALWNYVIWNGRQARGLRYVREKFADPSFKPPAKRDFEGTLHRGLRRLRRRSTAYSLVGTQMINGFFAVMADSARLTRAGRRAEAFVTSASAKFEPCRPELWMRNTRSPRQTITNDVDRWAKRFGLNSTGKAADSSQKTKDLVRRAYLQSRPVLHMMHALNDVCTEIGPKLDGWDNWDWLLVLLWNPEAWVWEAIKTASTWRETSRFHFTPDLAPNHMIDLILPKKMQDNAPCRDPLLRAIPAAEEGAVDANTKRTDDIHSRSDGSAERGSDGNYGRAPTPGLTGQGGS